MWFFFFCTSPGGMAYVLPRERHCWINHQAFLTNGTLLSVLYKWRLFSWKERCFSSRHHTTHAGSSCLEACEQLRFSSGNAAQITLQVSSVADGTTETSCKQVTVPFRGDNGAQWQMLLETKLSCTGLLPMHPCVWLLVFLISLSLPPKGFPVSWHCCRTVSRQTANASPNLCGSVPGAAARISPKEDCNDLPFSPVAR